MNEKYYNKKIENRNKIIEMQKKELELLKRQVEFYRNEAYTDSLTKLNNRRAITNLEQYESVIFCDIDHFKKINDQRGHHTGDLVLVEIGKILKSCVRENDFVARWGGEEFIILLKNCDIKDAHNKALALKSAMKLLSKKLGFTITLSFGISSLNKDNLKNAINDADKAMYKSKRDGRNRITIYQQKNI